MVQKIAIQGIKGAFHQEAAKLYFNNNICIDECITFAALIESVETGKSKYGIMAIENSLVGSILPNYVLLRESSLSVIGEIYLRIVQNLLALPNQSINNLIEVHSHPMALAQCNDFLSRYPHIRIVESDDTALSAYNIANKKIVGVGAIASLEAAKEYGLEILAEGIETTRNNYTRFMILSKEQTQNTQEMNKASIVFSLAHKPGSLQQALQSFSRYGINLTMLQSLPQSGHNWQYYFHADLTFRHIDDFNIAQIELKKHTNYIKILGLYKKGNRLV